MNDGITTQHVRGGPPATGQAGARTDDPWPDADGPEQLHEGGTHLLDLVAAVDHLGRGLRHNFTVWDALEEALGWLIDDPAAADPERTLPTDDPLGTRLTQLVASPSRPAGAAEILQTAVRRWNETMAQRFNAGNHWNHPTPRRGFPPPHHGN